MAARVSRAAIFHEGPNFISLQPHKKFGAVRILANVAAASSSFEAKSRR
jgi:hypothetical protein